MGRLMGQLVTIWTPEGPYFLFSRALYPFPIHSHTYLPFSHCLPRLAYHL